jgi:predicted nucleotidyltransferase component of viral defense system
MNESRRGIIASIHQRLLNKARAAERPFNELLLYYAMEKFLLRISKLPNTEDYILKGALLLRAVGMPNMRPTRDIDVLKYGNSALTHIEKNFVECCKINIKEDGLVFDHKSMQVDETRKQEIYDGMRMKIQGNLGTACFTIQVDVGFGDVVTPRSLWIKYPSIFDDEEPKLRAYSLETVIAEKYETMVKLDLANSRMKDFYDIYFLFAHCSLNRRNLQVAIKQTFERRGTTIPATMPSYFLLSA